MSEIKETTIILGAGVNKEINESISTGIELLHDVANRVTDRTAPGGEYLSNAIKRYTGLEPQVFENFLMHLDHYNDTVESPSMDAFLHEIETFPEFERDKDNFKKIGMLMILSQVVGWEGSETVTKLEKERIERKTWLSVLSDYIRTNKLIHGPKLKIITFNYDRILEWYLKAEFGEQGCQFVNENVQHVYGRIANYPGLERKKNEVDIDFGLENSKFEVLDRLKDNIQLMRDIVNTETIKSAVSRAKKLIILGYAFDSTNNQRIGLTEYKNHHAKMICNVYSGPLPNWNFQSRRKQAAIIQSLRLDAHIKYKTCRNFLNDALEDTSGF